MAELLGDREESHAARLADAATVARQFGLTRTWVYQHAEQLGAIRLGHGPKARLRFDLPAVGEALRSGHPTPNFDRSRCRARTRRPRQPEPDVPLLPITGPPGLGVLSRLALRRRKGKR